MPLSTYDELQTSILSWLARPGDPLVSPAVPDMIQLFEREATRRLKVGGAEKRASLTALSAAVALPADFGELRLATSGGVVLSYVTPMQLPDGGGPPAHYTIIGNEMRLGPSPSGGCTVEIVYQSGVPPLSDTNISNWLLAAHPDCYLFGSLVEAESFIGSDERVPLWAQRREAAFASIETADRKARWGGAPLSIRAEGVSGGNGTAAGDWTSAPPVPIPIAGIVAGTGLTGGGSEGIVTVALDTPVSVANGGTGNIAPFVADRIVTASGAGALQSTSGRLDSLGDAYARSFATEGVGTDGGLWWGKYGGGFWKWALYSDTGDVAHFQRWEADSPVGDVFTADHATGLVAFAGDVDGLSFSAGGLGTAGGVWWSGTATEGWGWHATAGVAHLGRWNGATSVGDALAVNYATGVVNLPNGATAPTPAPGDNDTSLATTAFVQAALAAGGSGINQLTGDVTAGPGTGSQASAIAANAVTTAKILNANVTYGKLQNVTAARLLGNPTGSAASPSEISLGTNLSFAGTVLNATAGGSGLSGMTTGQIPVAATATTVTSSVPTGTSGNSTVVQTNASGTLVSGVMPAHTGDVTSPAGSTVNTLATVNSNIGTFNNITINGKGLATAGSNTAYLTASGVSGMTAGQIPIAATATTITSSGNLSGAVTTSGSLATTLANNAVVTASITNANVTYAKIQNVAANRLLGNATGSAAAPAEIVLPLAIANGGTNAAALALNAAGGYGLTRTFLWSDGTTVAPDSDATGTVGAAGGGNVYALGLGVSGGLGLGRANGTFASPTALALGQAIGVINFDGTYASAWDAAPRATIAVNATENWTSAANGTSLVFNTTLTGTLTTATRVTVQAGVLVGAATGGDKGVGTVNATIVHANGTVLTSDARLKRDIEALPDCLPLVAAIEPKAYRWREPDEPDMMPPGWAERVNWGFMAQDTAVAPGIHHRDEDGTESVDLGGLVAVLWKALQEANARIEALEAKSA